MGVGPFMDRIYKTCKLRKSLNRKAVTEKSVAVYLLYALAHNKSRTPQEREVRAVEVSKIFFNSAIFLQS